MADPVLLAGGAVAALVVFTLATRTNGKSKATAAKPKAQPKSKDPIVAKALERGDYGAAAARVAETGDNEGAYELYLLANLPLKAAETALALGKPGMAGELYERAGETERAIVAYRLAEMTSKVNELEAEKRKAEAKKAPVKISGPGERAEQAEQQWRDEFRNLKSSDTVAKEQCEALAHAAAEAWISAGDMARAAALCREAGLLDAAVNLYVNALGDSASAGEIMLERGDPKRAAELFELGGKTDRAVEAWIAWSKDAEDPLAHLDEVKRLGEEATTKFCNAVLKAHPIVKNNLDLHYKIATQINHDPVRAKEVIDQISSVQPGYRDVDSRLAQLEDAIAKMPRPAEGVAFVGTADAPASTQMVGVVAPTGADSVAKLRDSVLGREPDLGNIEIYYRLGMALLARARYPEAKRAFSDVEDACPGYRDAAARAEEIAAWQEEALASIAGNGRTPTIDGRFKLGTALGRSEKAAVFRAREMARDREVALKLPTDEAAEDPAFLVSFAQHARAAMGLNHPNIVTIHEVGEVERRPFVCMELVAGTSIDAMLAKKARLPAPIALAVAEQALLALEHAHKKSIIHRDLKPANIMCGPSGEVKLLDFGLIAAVNVAELEISDSPLYMAPEQLYGQKPDARADLFALGACLFEIITGDAPFDGPNRAQAPPPLREVLPSASEPMEQLVARAMEMDAELRFGSASEMLASVRQLKAAF